MCFQKQNIMLSTGRSLIGRAWVLIAWPSPIVPKFPTRGNFGDDGHVALGTSQGFLNSSKIKYIGGDSVSGKAVHVWHFFLKNQFFQNDLPDLDSLVIYQSHIAHCELRLRTVTIWVRTVAWGPRGASTVFGDSARKARELDSNSWYLVLSALMYFFALHLHWHWCAYVTVFSICYSWLVFRRLA